MKYIILDFKRYTLHKYMHSGAEIGKIVCMIANVGTFFSKEVLPELNLAIEADPLGIRCSSEIDQMCSDI